MAEPAVSVDQFPVEDLLNIHQMIFLPSTLDLLVNHLEKGIANGGASPDLCSAILRLYLLYPQCANAEVIRKILVQTIVALPENQFGYYACIAPSHFASAEDEKRVQDMLTLQDHLEGCDFKAAWGLLREPDMADVLHTPGVVDAVRRYACEVLQQTFTTISLTDFCQMMNLGQPVSASGSVDEKVEKLIKARGWAIEDAGQGANKVVRVVPREAETAKPLATRASVAHKTIEKYLSVEGLQQCLTLLES
ncbi:uncharacterized protein LOC34623536 [Cyclospora cayetanensis]|uniref:Uncharacterized protein LOC34623536 n=2 Tax=Cyclospora cayetanensis TaxID=88456 RepID=A0A6P5WE84_9EIME|nr:uncharacterized protein LOC34623536 [Cyclospora cayetanensis]OEH80294.1 eukaryotic translation initiation factor 3 subunit [Cyclospora cayetanensis]